jgi:hypothetical protein
MSNRYWIGKFYLGDLSTPAERLIIQKRKDSEKGKVKVLIYCRASAESFRIITEGEALSVISYRVNRCCCHRSFVPMAYVTSLNYALD